MNAALIARTAGALMLVGALTGCGSDNPLSSTGPDNSPPSSPTNLRFSGPLLSWDLSPEADVAGYEVEAGLSNPQVTFVPVSSRSTAIPAYDLSSRSEYLNNWYRVRARDVAGNRSTPSNSVFVTNEQAGGAPSLDDPSFVNAGPLNP